MKISIVFHTSPRVAGGGTKIIYEYANFLAAKGYLIQFQYMANELWSRFHLPESIRRLLARVSIFKRPNWFKLNSSIKKKAVFNVCDDTFDDADVVIATDVRTAVPVNSLSSCKGRKVYFIQDFENWSLPDAEVYRTYGLGMKNITVSKWLCEFVDQYSVEPSVCINNSINTELFRVINPIEQRKKHTMAFHYRSAETKGCQYAIKVIEVLQSKYPDLSVEVVGIEDRPENLPSCCNYHHRITPEKVARINNKVAIFICSSIKEGFGLPGLEAMACGCALAASEYQGVSEYAIDKENALLSPIRDVDSMVKNVESLFDDELRWKIARSGVNTAQLRSFIASAERLENILTNRLSL